MPIRAHDDEVDLIVCCSGKQHITDIYVACNDLLRFCLDSVASEMETDVCTGEINVSPLDVARIDRQNLHLFGTLEEGQGVIHSTNGFPT